MYNIVTDILCTVTWHLSLRRSVPLHVQLVAKVTAAPYIMLAHLTQTKRNTMVRRRQTMDTAHPM